MKFENSTNRKILYFINPVSGSNRNLHLEEKLIAATLEQEIFFEILYTNAGGDYPFLLSKIKREEFTDVVVCGGDGTVNQIASHLLGVDINIGIVPIGSGNGLALAAKLSRNINKALHIIFTGTPTFVDAFFINEKFSCMLCGLGFDAQVAHDFALQPTRGLTTYIKQTIKNFINAQPYEFDITLGGKTFFTEAFFISIANGNQFGNNFTIAPKASLHDGLLDIVVVKKTSKLRMIRAILKQIRSGEVQREESPGIYRNNKHDVLYLQTDKLIIHNHELAPLHIDGDPAQTDKLFKIEILPKAFKLIVP